MKAGVRGNLTNMPKNAKTSNYSIKDFLRPNVAKTPVTISSSSSPHQEGASLADPIMISSSASVPKSTQSSRRIDIKGVQVVIDSDDDSDDLPDVDIMLQAYRSERVFKPPRLPEPTINKKKEKQSKQTKQIMDNLLKELQADRDRES